MAKENQDIGILELRSEKEEMTEYAQTLLNYAKDPHSGGGEKEEKEALKIIKEIEDGKYD